MGTGDMAESGRNKHKSRVPIWKSTNYPSSSAHFTQDPLKGIIGPDPGQVSIREVIVGDSIINALCNDLGGLNKFLGSELFDDCLREKVFPGGGRY